MQQLEETNKFYLDILCELVSQPTAPFHEERVARRVITYLKEWNVPFEIDEFGNLIAHYRRGHNCRPLVLMAHMDHPAFEIVKTGGMHDADFSAKLQGGVNSKCFEQPVDVKIYPQANLENSVGISAKIVGFKQGEKPRDIELYVKLNDSAKKDAIQVGDFGIWDLLDFELTDGFIHARVMDDLVGCAATLSTLWKLVQEQVETDVYGVFTRAEEVGLVGASAVFESGRLPKNAYIVSLEASKTLPGAIQGEGPVVRVGDRTFTFNDEAEIVLRAAAKSLNKNVPNQSEALYKTQRQLMSGGGCEAGAALLAGYVATGLAFPLGNYHNVTADYKLEPEYIHEADYITGIALLQEAARLMPGSTKLNDEVISSYTNNKPLVQQLKDTAAQIQKLGQLNS